MYRVYFCRASEHSAVMGNGSGIVLSIQRNRLQRTSLTVHNIRIRVCRIIRYASNVRMPFLWHD